MIMNSSGQIAPETVHDHGWCGNGYKGPLISQRGDLGETIMTDTIPAGAPAPGTYTLDPERTTIRADPGASSVQTSIAAGSYASGHTKRDADVTSASLLDARAFPEITFSGQGARRDGDDWVVPGSVTAHGTAVPAEIRLSDARQEDGEARFRATARLDRTSFGVTKKKGMVGRTVDLVIEAVAQPA